MRVNKIYTAINLGLAVLPGANRPQNYLIINNLRYNKLVRLYWGLKIYIGANQIVPLSVNDECYYRLQILPPTNNEFLNNLMLVGTGVFDAPLNNVNRSITYIEPGQYEPGIAFNYQLQIGLVFTNLSPLLTYTYDFSVFAEIEEENL